MIIKAYIPTSRIEDAVSVLQSLPRQIRPDRFSSDEDEEKVEGRIDDGLKFKTFIAKNRYGFFLFGERARYNVVPHPKNGFSHLMADELDGGLAESDAIAVLNVSVSAGAAFAFAASSEEYHHRNRYVRTLGENQFEAWIGRDARKYVPGVYWLTVLSAEHADTVATFSKSLGATITQMDSQHVLLKVFDSPNEWQRHADRIDEWLAKQPSFFSKRRVLPQLNSAFDIGALSEVAGEWR